MTADHTETQHGPNTRRVTVAEAAEILGITAEAVRTRIKRDKLRAVKEPPDRTGTVYVLLQADQTGPNIDPTPQGQDQTGGRTAVEDELRERVEDLRERVASLERALERRDDETERLHRIIGGLTQANTNLAARVPQLEAPAAQEAR